MKESIESNDEMIKYQRSEDYSESYKRSDREGSVGAATEIKSTEMKSKHGIYSRRLIHESLEKALIARG